MADLSRNLAMPFHRPLDPYAKLRVLARQAREPLQEQVAYTKALRTVVIDQLRAAVRRAFSSELQDVMDDDLLAYELRRQVNALEFEFGRVATSEQTRGVVQNAAVATNRFSMQSQQRLIQASLEAAVAKHAIKASVPALNVFADNPGLAHARDVFTERNVSLIKNLSADAYGQVQSVVTSGIQAGTRSKDLAQQIMERLDVAESRAQLIARDQVLKFNGELAKTRQGAAGITSFTWYSSLDQRVRPSHRALHGQVFAWAALPVVDGQQASPGSPVQCRCIALPFFG